MPAVGLQLVVGGGRAGLQAGHRAQFRLSGSAPLVRHQLPGSGRAIRRGDLAPSPRAGRRPPVAGRQDEPGNDVVFCGSSRASVARAVDRPLSSTRVSCWRECSAGASTPPCRGSTKPGQNSRPRLGVLRTARTRWRGSAVCAAFRETRKVLGAVLAKLTGLSERRYVSPTLFAQVYAALGDKNGALEPAGRSRGRPCGRPRLGCSSDLCLRDFVRNLGL